MLESRKRAASESSNDDEKDMGQRALRRLLEDYPAPLTHQQRTLFFRHVASHVRRYDAIVRASRTVLRGWESLHNVMCALRSEKEAIERGLRELDTVQQGGAPVPTPGASPADDTVRHDDPGDAETSSAADTAPARPRRFLVGGRGGRGGGVFAHLQSVLKSAQKEEETQRHSDARLARERIARETRLKIVEEDLAVHNQYYAPLEARRLQCDALETECRETYIVPLLALQQTLYAQEGRYAAAFSLRASGPAATGGMFGPDDESDATAMGAMSVASTDAMPPPPSPYPAARCDVYCAPMTYTEELLDVIRSQVEDVLDDYLTYRARMDPILSRIEQEKAAHEAQRVDRLLGLVGVLEGNPSGLGGPLAVGGDGVGVLSAEGGVLGHAPPPIKPVLAGLGISDEDEDDAGLLDGALGFDRDDQDEHGALSGADAKKQEKARIQSALSVLDDFESMF